MSDNKPQPVVVEEVLPEAWDPFFKAHEAFLNSLDCLNEVFRTVAPILEAKDKERQEKAASLGEEIKHSDGRVGRRLKSLGTKLVLA